MNSNRKTAIIVGILIIIGIIAGMMSIVPSVESPDYLTKFLQTKIKCLQEHCFSLPAHADLQSRLM